MTQRRDITTGDRRSISSGDRRSIGSTDRRALAADRSDRAFFGDLPARITDNVDNVEQVDFWTSHEKYTEYSDNDGIDPLLDFSGGNHISQETTADQATYRTDVIECDGSDFYTSDRFPTSPDAITILSVAQETGGNFTTGVFGHRATDADPSLAYFFDANNGEVESNIGKGGSTTGASVAVDPSAGMVVSAVRWNGLNTSSQSLKIWAEDGSGTVSASTSTSFSAGFALETETFFALEPDGSFSGGKDIESLVRIGADLTDTQVSNMVSDFATYHGVT